MMKFSVLTLFPEMMSALGESIIGRAISKGIISTEYVNLRDYSKDKHRRVDDYPYGAGGGMVMQPQPITDCFDAIKAEVPDTYCIYLSPKGKRLTQSRAKKLLFFAPIVSLTYY